MKVKNELISKLVHFRKAVSAHKMRTIKTVNEIEAYKVVKFRRALAPSPALAPRPRLAPSYPRTMPIQLCAKLNTGYIAAYAHLRLQYLDCGGLGTIMKPDMSYRLNKYAGRLVCQC